jgi:predicted dehydrogenase
MPSWNWSFARKDMELYGTNGTAVTVGPSNIRTQFRGEKQDRTTEAPALPANVASSLGLLAAVLRGEVKDTGDLSALDTNMIVMQILDAARTSAATGRTVMLKPLPQ